MEYTILAQTTPKTKSETSKGLTPEQIAAGTRLWGDKLNENQLAVALNFFAKNSGIDMSTIKLQIPKSKIPHFHYTDRKGVQTEAIIKNGMMTILGAPTEKDTMARRLAEAERIAASLLKSMSEKTPPALKHVDHITCSLQGNNLVFSYKMTTDANFAYELSHYRTEQQRRPKAETIEYAILNPKVTVSKEYITQSEADAKHIAWELLHGSQIPPVVLHESNVRDSIWTDQQKQILNACKVLAAAESESEVTVSSDETYSGCVLDISGVRVPFSTSTNRFDIRGTINRAKSRVLNVYEKNKLRMTLEPLYKAACKKHPGMMVDVRNLSSKNCVKVVVTCDGEPCVMEYKEMPDGDLSRIIQDHFEEARETVRRKIERTEEFCRNLPYSKEYLSEAIAVFIQTNESYVTANACADMLCSGKTRFSGDLTSTKYDGKFWMFSRQTVIDRIDAMCRDDLLCAKTLKGTFGKFDIYRPQAIISSFIKVVQEPQPIGRSVVDEKSSDAQVLAFIERDIQKTYTDKTMSEHILAVLPHMGAAAKNWDLFSAYVSKAPDNIAVYISTMATMAETADERRYFKALSHEIKAAKIAK